MMNKNNTGWLILAITYIPMGVLGFWLGCKLFERVKW